MSDYVEKMVDLLNQKNLNREDGMAVSSCAFRACNSFSHGKLYDSFHELSSLGKKRLKAIACAFALRFVYERDYEHDCQPTWDDRKRASEDFACAHFRDFIRGFEESGEPMEPRYYGKWVNYGEKPPLQAYLLWEESWLSGFMSDWNGEHPTVKQSCFGQLCRFLVDEGVLHCEAPRFPFI